MAYVRGFLKEVVHHPGYGDHEQNHDDEPHEAAWTEASLDRASVFHTLDMGTTGLMNKVPLHQTAAMSLPPSDELLDTMPRGFL